MLKFNKETNIDAQFNKVIHSDYMHEYLKYFDIDEILKWAEDENLEKIPEENIDRFDWYVVYYFPDNWVIKENSWHKNMSYWIAYITKKGKEHKHMMSDAYNKIISWKWIFTGKDSIYDWMEMLPWTEFEIPKGMWHGHEITQSPMKMFFCQWCWFRQNMACKNDFILAEWSSDLLDTVNK